MKPKYECLKCGFVCDEYSRPHLPPEQEPHEYEYNPTFIPYRPRTTNACWGTVVSTYKYNHPV